MSDLNLTSIDNAIDDEFIQFYNLKRSLMSFFDIDKILKFIVETINETDHISFSSPRSAKYISKDNPVFKLVLDLDKLLQKEFENNNKSIQLTKGSPTKLEDFKMAIVYNSIIAKTTSFMFEEIMKLKEDHNNIEAVTLFKDIPNEDKLKDIMLLTVFKILIEEGQTMFPIVNIEYFF